jgi:hypothetical protein
MSEEAAPDPRFAILERFRAGQIAKEQADEEAVAAGYHSMEFTPDTTNISCFELARWTLPQAVSWIIYRSSEAVLALAEEVRRASRVWREKGRYNVKNGKVDVAWDLVIPERASVYDVVDEAARREDLEPCELDGIQACDQFIERLQRSALIAYGVSRGEQEHRPIAKTAWDTIDSITCTCSHLDPEDIGSERERTARYSKVFVLPEDVRAMWPPLHNSIDATVASVASPKPNKPEAAAQALTRLFPNGRPSLTVPELIRELNTKAPGIGIVSPRTMSRAIPLAWPTTVPKRAK